MRLVLAALAATFATAAAAQTSAPTSLQATYNAAQAALDKGDWSSAATGFAQVLAGASKEDRSTAIIRIRLADALMNLQRFDEAQAQAERGVTEMRAQATGPDAELAAGYEALGDIKRLNFDYDGAIAAYQHVETFAAPDDKGIVDLANVGIIQAAMVTHPDLAVSTAAGMIDDPAFGARSADLRSQIYALRARAALNLGDAKAARKFIDEAINLSGSLAASTISLSQEEVRSDAALVYAKLKDLDETHRFLAYSGAGNQPGQDWFGSAQIESPVCGPEINADDTAVVEFSIADDGKTAGAAPVYASRPGPMGVEFARAVREWHWSPQAVAASPPFWRAAIRIQMRCASRPPPLALSRPFVEATNDWLRGNGVSEEVVGSPPRAANAAPRSPVATAIAVLFRKVARDHDDKALAADAAELDALLVQTGAPIEARAFAAEMAARGAGYTMHGWTTERVRRLDAALPKFDQAPGGRRAAAWLRVEMATSLEADGQFAAAKAPLATVVDLPASQLGPNDPIRSVAVLHLALVETKLGDPAAAKALQRESGLTQAGCNLLDIRPIPVSEQVDDSKFPEEANRWGFDGWVRVGYDIGANGGVQDARALMSYPPFIFDDAASNIISRFRYLPPNLGGEPLSCSGETKLVKFNRAPP